MLAVIFDCKGNEPGCLEMKQNDPHVCARCAALGECCCKLTPGQEEVCFPLSEFEKDAIRDVTHAKGWFTGQENTSAFVNNLCRLFPGEEDMVRKIFLPRREHFRLATRSDGSCALLGDSGCILPQQVRPLYCRLFPLWTVGRQIMALGPQCLAIREAGTMGRLMESMAVSKAKVFDLHSRLRLAWGLPPKIGDPVVTLRLQRDNK